MLGPVSTWMGDRPNDKYARCCEKVFSQVEAWVHVEYRIPKEFVSLSHGKLYLRINWLKKMLLSCSSAQNSSSCEFADFGL
jgi:hypothetical protein